MADETLNAGLHLSTTEIKEGIDTIMKKKQQTVLVCYFVSMLPIFFKVLPHIIQILCDNVVLHHFFNR